MKDQKTLRIGIDASWACGNLTGTGRFTHDLIKELATLDNANSYFLYFRECCRINNPLFTLENENVVKRVIDSRSRVLRILLPLSFQLERDSIDVFLSTAYFLPLFGCKKWIVTFFDFNVYWLAKEWARPGTTKGLFLMRTLFPISIRKASHIVTISLATHKDLGHFFPNAMHKASVIYPGIDLGKPRTACLAADKSASPFFLFVGDLSPMKNVARIIEAFYRFKKNDKRGFKFVFAGRDVGGYLPGVLRPLVAKLQIDDYVEFCGFVSNNRLAELYATANCLVYPSLREGFGYPIVDAMQVGLPVITSNVSSCPEVGGEAALYVDPESVEAISHALARISADESLREEMVRKGRDRSQLFSIKTTVAQYLCLLTKIGNEVL